MQIQMDRPNSTDPAAQAPVMHAMQAQMGQTQ
jgi:hypothetical protein